MKTVTMVVAALGVASCAASFGKDFAISDFGAVADGRLCTKAFAAAMRGTGPIPDGGFCAKMMVFCELTVVRRG